MGRGERRGLLGPPTSQRTELHACYLDGFLAALDLLDLGLGQGHPLPDGLQLTPAELYSLGDPATKKKGKTKTNNQGWRLLPKPLQPLAPLLFPTANR